MDTSRVKILFNLPNPQLHGGAAVCAPVLERELRTLADLQTFEYGRKTDTETLFNKVLGRSRDLIILRSRISALRPTVVHHNTAFDRMAIIRDAPLVWLGKIYNVPILLVMHGSLDESFERMGPVLQQLRDSLIKNADCIGVLSDLEREKFLKTWPFLGARVRVVKNIIQPVFYTILRQEALSPTLLFISRFIRKKGPFTLLDAIPGVLEKFPTARFIFIGSGADECEFDRRVQEKRLDLSVQRIAHIDNLATAEFYRTAWAFIFPTYFPEGMPMVVAQAMAAGVPIITTRTNFSLSYMSPGDHCLFAESGNPVSIKDQIVFLLQDGELRRRMSSNNRRLAQSFRAEIVAGEFLGIYKSLQQRRDSKQISW
jgi:glycosyltransferase involved in cell wall biosynthesis